jgi:Mg-chelatase subunit ChlD
MNNHEAADATGATSQAERARRWRLALGSDAQEQTCKLTGDDQAIDKALQALYNPGPRSAGLGPSAPSVPRWLGDIRRFFPSSVVRVMQKDAIDRLNMTSLLLEKEVLDQVEPDVHLVASILSLQGVLPAKTRDTARQVVQKLVDELTRKIENPLRQAVAGALNRAIKNNNPRLREIDWHRTIRANLRHYQPDHKTVVPHRRIGYGRKRSSLKDVILCIDQSGSMAASVVYSSIFGAVMASIPAVTTRLVVFDTAVVDLTDQLTDPVELLFSTQLGGGTDINRAVGYCQSLITRPTDTVVVLISDLYEGGVEEGLLRKTHELVSSGVQVVVLLALSDEGRPSYDESLAAKLAALGAPSFACTPDLFPDLMAAALRKDDIAQWAASQDIKPPRAEA